MKTEHKLEQVLQAVIDSGIDLTISSLCDRGIDFAFLPFTRVSEGLYDLNDWHYVHAYSQLADQIDSCVKERPTQNRYPLTLEAMGSLDEARRDLSSTLQGLYDSKIDVTISWMRLEGIGFALVSCADYVDLKPQDWHQVPNFYALAEALHRAAVQEFKSSEYARRASTAPLTSTGSI